MYRINTDGKKKEWLRYMLESLITGEVIELETERHKFGKGAGKAIGSIPDGSALQLSHAHADTYAWQNTGHGETSAKME